MTKHKKIKYYYIVGTLLFLLFSGFGMYYIRLVQDNLATASARYEQASVSPRMMSSALENFQYSTGMNEPSITLWNRLEKETVSSGITELPVETNVIETYGDMSQVLPMTFVDGNYAYVDDEEGCVLDTKTAYDLFGTVNAVNNIVVWKSKQYVVRGVAKEKDTMMAIEVADEDHLYNNIEADFKKKGSKMIVDNQGQLLKDMLVTNGMPEPKTIIDGNRVSWLLSLLYHLPMWILAFALILVLVKYTYRMRGSITLLVTYGMVTFILSVIVLKLVNFQIHIPAEFIPTKWSDFDFYTETYKGIKEEMVNIQNCKQMPKDILRASLQSRCITFSLLNVFLLILAKFLGFTSEK